MLTNNVNTQTQTETQEATTFQSTKNQHTSALLSAEIVSERLARLTTRSAKIAYILKLIRTLYTNKAQYNNEKANIQKTANTLNIPPQLLNDIERWVFVHNNNVKSINNIKH